uniref:Stress up-regulated Nod 19 n=1 Tax=Kalanchoe fedtschenkoi TaxID=63787 RepID=A0A7N0TWY5_KALFE
MVHITWSCMVLGAILILSFTAQISAKAVVDENGVKTSVFLSPKFVMGPGSVVNRVYDNVDFPKGHIAIKSFDAEVVDEAGSPVPLQETYLHHWVVVRYQQKIDADIPESIGNLGLHQSKYSVLPNSGVCQNEVLEQYFGLGSETRKTSTHVPDPYGIEIGNPSDISPGYEERWMLNVHAIDTREVQDKLGCTECRCDLYNVTQDERGQPLNPNYRGGLRCCHDHLQCKLKEGSEGTTRALYMKFTVKWVEWSSSVVPVRIYIFDVTDTWRKENNPVHHCLVEYEVEPCNSGEDCTHIKRATSPIPKGGHVIYAVAHQHSGGNGSALYGEDGRLICASVPTYGTGTEPGNEAGYIVGMSTCYPEPGSVALSDGEMLTLESNYSRTQFHTGVMGLFYILIADHPERPLHTNHVQGQTTRPFEPLDLVPMIGLLGLVVIAAAGIAYHRRRFQTEDGYQSIVM